jgi:hypothetical protein
MRRQRILGNDERRRLLQIRREWPIATVWDSSHASPPPIPGDASRDQGAIVRPLSK